MLLFFTVGHYGKNGNGFGQGCDDHGGFGFTYGENHCLSNSKGGGSGDGFFRGGGYGYGCERGSDSGDGNGYGDFLRGENNSAYTKTASTITKRR